VLSDAWRSRGRRRRGPGDLPQGLPEPGSLRRRAFLSTWLLSIAAHHCIDKLRRKKFSSFSIDEDEEGQTEIPDGAAPDPENEAVRKQTRERLQGCLQSLDPIDRAAVVMRYWQDSSEVEIAQALKLTVPAVKSRLHRARRALADLWEEKDKKAHVRHERKVYGSPAF
jgi:RNA polymerase sigma-70 factor (ECF subfamily)